MKLRRAFVHLLTPPWHLARVLPAQTLERIEQAVRDNEAHHRGEIRFAVEAALDFQHLLHGISARSRALQVFADLRVWDTEENNGVLIYLLLAERDFEIVADRGIHRHLGDDGWEQIARAMEGCFRNGQIERGVIEGVRAIGRHLGQHFPARSGDINELPDRPSVV